MKYSTIEYVATEWPTELHLHSFDGTFRAVGFRSEEEAAAALLDGRAEADCTAVENGLLPRGAFLVSRPCPLDVDAVLADTLGLDTRDPSYPLASVRLKFSQKLLVDRGADITEPTDAATREDRPQDARRYDALVDLLDRARRDGGLL